METERQGSWVRIQMFHTTRKGWVQSPLLAPRFPGETVAASPLAKPLVPRAVDREFLVEVKGIAGGPIRGGCRVESTDGDTKFVRLKGSVPKVFHIRAASLAKCTFIDTTNVQRVRIIVDGRVRQVKSYHRTRYRQPR